MTRVAESLASEVALNDSHWVARDWGLIRDSRGHGCGYGGSLPTKTHLNNIAASIAAASQVGGLLAGYGVRHFAAADGYAVAPGGVQLPVGYDATNHPEREGRCSTLLDPDRPTSLADMWQLPGSLQAFFQSCGWDLDQHGRACNPYGELLVSHPGIGLNAGIGAACELGETVHVNVVVTDGNKVLLVAGQGKKPPTPISGCSQHVDYDVKLDKWRAGYRPVTCEGIFRTARRIVQSMTGIVLPNAESKVVWGARCMNPRDTWNAWTFDCTVRVLLPSNQVSQPKGGAGRWYSRHDLTRAFSAMTPAQRYGYVAATSL